MLDKQIDVHITFQTGMLETFMRVVDHAALDPSFRGHWFTMFSHGESICADVSTPCWAVAPMHTLLGCCSNAFTNAANAGHDLDRNISYPLCSTFAPSQKYICMVLRMQCFTHALGNSPCAMVIAGICICGACSTPMTVDSHVSSPPTRIKSE